MDFMDTVKKLIDSASQDVMHALLRIIGALLLLLIGFKVIKWVCKKLKESKFSKKLDSSLASFLNSFISITLNLLLVVLAVSILGVPMATIVTVVGTAGLAIGLALQGSLSNFAGGFIIILFKPFSVGDYIEVGGYAGNVTDIGLFYTTLVSLDHSRISLPNSVVSSKELVNCSAVGTRVVNLEIGVGYDADVAKAERTLVGVAKDCELSLKDREPIAFVAKYADSSIIINLRYWVRSQDYLTSQADVMDKIKIAFDESGITFPFPQLDVHLDK
ncbi:MAG: mechanosensitive ion channel [Clostridiales bacterium]|nr:mechanosensitive ion channel [Clostridiales bacterium]